MVEFLRNVFSAALKTNDALEKGVLTGCLRIAKESIFTGLNNFKVNSIFDGDENQQFGFMQNEIDILLEKYDALEYRYNIKEWYDGYQFGGCDVYNPWSVLMYMDRLTNSNNKSPESFWANTSGNDVIYRFIQQGNAEMKQDFDILSSGGMIEKTIKPELTYRELDDTDNLYSFLLFTGYLKAISKTDTNTYQLMIPNKEIQYIYTTIFEEWFKQQIRSYQASFLEALLQEHVEEANEILNTVLFQSMSYFDYDEKYYHGFLNGMLQGKGSYRIVSNQESGFGRCDLAVLPAYNKNRGLLLELKVAKREEDDGATPDDITRTPPVYPCSRSSRLQQLMRGDEGYLLALAYSTQRGYGRNHPFAGEIRSGYIDVSIVPEELGFAVNVGELLMTECEMVNGFIDPPDEPPHFTRGYGLVFGMSERKAMAMALVDRALQAPEYGEHATGPAQDEEFVLAHADNVEAAGFVSHLKLPHYVDFQAELELLKRLQQEATRDH